MDTNLNVSKDCGEVPERPFQVETIDFVKNPNAHSLLKFQPIRGLEPTLGQSTPPRSREFSEAQVRSS